MDTFGPLVGVVIGAAIGFLGSWLLARQSLRRRWDSDRRDAYVDFLISVQTSARMFLEQFEMYAKASKEGKGLDEITDALAAILEKAQQNYDQSNRFSREMWLLASDSVMDTVKIVMHKLYNISELAAIPSDEDVDLEERKAELTKAKAKFDKALEVFVRTVRAEWKI